MSSDCKPSGREDSGWIFLEEDTGKVYIKHEGIWILVNPAVSLSGVISDPPPGCSKVTNIYLDAEGKVKVQADTGG
jgi:hypothetical protein